MSEWMTSEDRAEAIAILQHLLTPEQLRRVIDPEIERFVARTENAGPRKLHKTRIDDEEFASFLLDLLGTELLRVPTLRREILASLPEDQLIHLASSNGGTPGPNREACIEQIMKIRWHPGGPWPRYIASFLGLRKIFAGIPASPDTPAEEVVEARLRLPDLHDYQQDLVHQVHQLLAAPPGENRAILCLPTGAGKTRTAVQALLTAWNLDKQEIPFILWVAQSDELCEQAAEAFKEVFVEFGSTGPRKLLHLYRYWGNRNSLPDTFGDGVIIATDQKLSEALKSESGRETLASLAPDIFAVVIDESHHAIAPSYLKFLDILGMKSSRDQHGSIPLLGLTATPYRGSSDDENRRLANLFSNRRLTASSLGDNPIHTLRTMGILSTVQHQILTTNRTFELTDEELSHLRQYQQFSGTFLRKVSQDHQRNAILLQQLLDLPSNWPVLFFGCSVEHAKAFTALLRRNGRSAAVITGETRKATRHHLIEEFRHGHLQFLCNYGVLTTGFDAPHIRAIVIARPTASAVMYEQMIGRGMRGPRNGGTEDCLVIDLEDNILRFENQMAYGRFTEYWA